MSNLGHHPAPFPAVRWAVRPVSAPVSRAADVWWDAFCYRHSFNQGTRLIAMVSMH